MRRLITFLASVAIAALAFGLTLVGKIPRTPLWLVGGIGTVSALLAAASGDRIKSELTRVLSPESAQRDVIADKFAPGPGGRGRALRVAQADALALGVHEAEQGERAGEGGGDLVPPYVRRDLHAWLVERIGGGGFVLLQGGSAAGKSRLAFEAMREAVPRYRLLVPDDGRALSALAATGPVPADSVIWLDDLERYIGPDALTRATLDKLCPPGSTRTVVLATLRLEARASLTGTGTETDRDLTRLAEDVLKRAAVNETTKTVDAQLTDGEQRTALALRDERIRHAVAHNDDGFGAILCGGPAAVDRWVRGAAGENPTGAALVSALIDCRRTGYPEPVPRTVLASLYRDYLKPAERHRPDLPTVENGLAWAIERRSGASCLIPQADDAYDPFDYLLDHLPPHLTTATIPARVWDTLIDRADPPTQTTMGTTAYLSGDLTQAEHCYRAAATSRHPTALLNLGILLADVGRTEEAERYYRQAIEAGDTGALLNLGVLLADAGRTEEAERYYRQAIEAGDTDALNNLGILLKNAGRTEEAERYYRQAIEAGHTDAPYNLGILLADAGRTEEAERYYRQAIEAGHARALNNLGNLLADAGRTEEAERYYRQAIEAGDTDALNNLGILLADAGRTEEAEQAYRQAIEAGHTGALNNLGILLKNAGRTEEAEGA